MGEEEVFPNSVYDGMVPLDMLAEVATDALKLEKSILSDDSSATTPENGASKASSQKRSATTSDLMNLEQIRVLSDKLLLKMFSEQSFDEIRKIFSYRCFLMPEKCCEVISSFGNENKARIQMRSHLLTHVAELLAKENKPDQRVRKRFFAEPLNLRRKRMQELVPKKRRRGKPAVKRAPVQKKISDKKTVVSKPKTVKGVVQKKRSISPKSTRQVSGQAAAANLIVSISHRKLRKSVSSQKSKKVEKENELMKYSSTEKDNLFYKNSKIKRLSADVQEDLNMINGYTFSIPEMQDADAAKKSNSEDVQGEDSLDILSNKGNKTSTVIDSCVSPDRESEVADVDGCDVDSRVATFQNHDHCYTSFIGKVHYSSDSFEPLKHGMKESLKSFSLSPPKSPDLSHLVITTMGFPFVYDPALPHISEITEISQSTTKRSYLKIREGGNSLKKSVTGSQNSASKLAKARKVLQFAVTEATEPDTEDDENVPISFDNNNNGEHVQPEKELHVGLLANKRHLNDKQKAHVKRLALKYINQMRMKKKNERGPLICKICRGGKFTAQATLMYHYRSHAGIKPFACDVCSATFTRQHSLKYHMLIHNNKSRFVCEECGRSFRHPSHYKEHLRRHTGETPYQCSDCTLRFKTRNTYKRHLKTRHGKILTAKGIRVLSVEEFDKVRTMPRKGVSKPLMTREAAAEWSDITYSKIPLKTDTLQDSNLEL